jgi:hypothetical protein
VELPDQSALDEVLFRLDRAGVPSIQTPNGILLSDPSQNGILLTTRAKE